MNNLQIYTISWAFTSMRKLPCPKFGKCTTYDSHNNCEEGTVPISIPHMGKQRDGEGKNLASDHSGNVVPQSTLNPWVTLPHTGEYNVRLQVLNSQKIQKTSMKKTF